jgi:hypothetical protein
MFFSILFCGDSIILEKRGVSLYFFVNTEIAMLLGDLLKI